jgi:hypothetical protein
MFPQDVPTEVALTRFRRISWRMIAVAAVVFVVTEAMEPAPLTFLAVSAVLGIATGWIGAYKESTRRRSHGVAFAAWIGMLWIGVAQDSVAPASSLGVWTGGSLVLIGMSAMHLFFAREFVESRQEWWREHGPELTRGLNPNPVTLRERWRVRCQIEARMVGWNTNVILTVLACLIVVVSGAGLIEGRDSSAWLFGLGVVMGAWGLYGVSVTR